MAANGCEIMANDQVKGFGASGGLEGLAQVARDAGGERRKLPPVHLWNPEFCGDIDMRIAADGTWFYLGTPIGRPALVQLFSTILRKDPERYVLVTPVERVGIKVDDAPFLGVELQRTEDSRGQVLRLRTNVEDWVEIDAAHPLRFEKGAADGLKPYVRAVSYTHLTLPTSDLV